MKTAGQALPQSADDPATEAAQRNVAHAHVPRNYLRILGVTVVCLLALKLFLALVTNQNFEWEVVGQYLTEKTVMHGLGMTLGLTVVAMVIGVVIGLVVAIGRISEKPVLRGFAFLFVWLFRGLPLLVQLLFWYNLSTLFPTLSLGIPWGPTFASWKTNDLITPLTAAIIGLALNEAAYMAEIIRAGIISVDSRQMETAMAFGMTRNRVLRRIVIPQAMRAIIPPTGNQLITMVKATSIVSVIAMGDLLHSVQNIYNATFQVIPLLMVAVVWYLLITTVLSVGQGAIERYYAKGEQEASI